MSSEKSKILENAQQYTIRAQIQKAIEEWKKLLTNTPNDANIYNTIGDLSLKNSSSSNPHGDAVSFYVKAAEQFESTGFALKAIAVYKKVLKITPNNKEVYMRLGNLDCERGLIGNAREDYLMAAKLFSQEGLIKDALEVYRKIADLDPSNLSVRTKIAEMFLKEGMKNAAIEEYNKIAGAYLKAGKREEAEHLYDVILDLQPDNINAVIETGRFHLKNGKVESALEYGKKALSLSPDSEDVLSFLAEVYNSTGIFDKAEESLTRIIELNPGELSYRETRASILFNKGDVENAACEYLEIGREYLNRRNIDKARLFTEKAVEIAPEMILAHELLFDIYLRNNMKEDVVGKGLFLAGHYQDSGDVEKAVDYYLRILKEDPFNVEAKERLTAIEAEKQIFQTDEETTVEVIPLEKSIIEEIPIDKKVDITNQLSSADVYIKYGLMEKAIAELQQIINTIDPMNEAAHIKLKDIYRITGEKEKVVEECLVLLNIFEANGERDKMERMINEASAISPEDRRVKGYKDRLYMKVNIPSQSHLPTLEKTERERGWADETDELLEEAGFYEQQGMIEEAINVYRKVLKIDSNNAVALRQLTLLGPEDRNVPIPEMEVIKPEKESSESFFDLGDMLKEDVVEEPPFRPLDEIFKEFNEGVKLQIDTGDYESHYDLGISYKEMGLFHEAVEEFKSCGPLTSRYFDASFMISLCHKELGEYREAIDALNKAIKNDQYNEKRHIALKYELGILLEITGQRDDALSIFRQIYFFDATYRDVSEKVLTLQRGR
ncbi:MAG: tetratricopeptide repeat protein [Nitrospirae bacterium]|nr:tetratricopeptide repeat protein [Nitrospirota bacterium]